MTVGGRFWNICCKPGHVVGEEGELARVLALRGLNPLALGRDLVLARDFFEELEVDLLVVRVFGQQNGANCPGLVDVVVVGADALLEVTAIHRRADL